MGTRTCPQGVVGVSPNAEAMGAHSTPVTCVGPPLICVFSTAQQPLDEVVGAVGWITSWPPCALELCEPAGPPLVFR